METVWKRLFLENWPRKVLALVTAVVVWLFVNNSIIETKVIPNVPIKIVNLPADKTVIGLLPNGTMSKRVILTISGTKTVIDQLEPEDLEVVLDADASNGHDEWIVNITKKNLINLNPEIDFLNHITNVDHNELVIKLSRLVKAKIPITIQPPAGDPPAGYEYLDYWPQKLTQEISGPEEEMQKLKAKGFDLTFDISEITKGELDTIQSSPGNYSDDEIRFIVPKQWKQIPVPFHNYALEDINDPEAQHMRVYFLRKQTLAVEKELPIDVFYPLPNSDAINPEKVKLVAGKYVDIKNGIPVFKVPLHVKNVSKLFLNIVRENMQITLVASPQKEREFLNWSLDIINPNQLEDTYVAFLITKLASDKSGQESLPKKREVLIRKRFREYLQRVRLFTDTDQKLNIESTIENDKIMINAY